MRRTTERLSKDEEQFLDYARNLSEIERQALADLMDLLKENPSTGLVGEAMQKSFWEPSAIVHYVKRELTRRRLTVIDGGVS